MLFRILGSLVVLVTACVAGVLFWPQGVGLQNQWIAAHVVALRGVCALVGAILALCFALLAIPRRARRFALAMATVFALFAVGNVAVIGARGIASTDPGEAGSPRSITVLSWNTKGEAPGVDTLTDLAITSHADIVVLPETTEKTGEELAVRMREHGRPMWVHSLAYDDVYKARSTTLLISPDLGRYHVVTVPYSGPPLNTNTLPTVVAEPVSGKGPRIVAAHAVSPRQWEVRNWRSDLDWLQKQCQTDDVIMAGDFNATLDHFAGHGDAGGDLGRCRDAAAQAGAAGVGTWPTGVPALLGTPIDHVLATANWRVDGFEVLQQYDRSGSMHRPVIARLTDTAG